MFKKKKIKDLEKENKELRILIKTLIREVSSLKDEVKNRPVEVHNHYHTNNLPNTQELTQQPTIKPQNDPCAPTLV